MTAWRRGLRRPRRAEARRPPVRERAARGRPDVRSRRDDREGNPLLAGEASARPASGGPQPPRRARSV